MNYVFKVFVNKFLNLYIEGFGGSKVQLYQGALDLQKVQLRLQTINKLLKDMLIPLTIIKADIESLKIDIPWAALSSQPISTHIRGLHIIMQYCEQTEVPTTVQQQSLINEEIRKHKEIDEQVLRRFVKKLLLNLQVDLQDIQVELLIRQQYRLQIVCEHFSTQCQDNIRINSEDIDQFHRELSVETFFIKLIRFKQEDVSTQQLFVLDKCNSFLERTKDSIQCNLEFNNINLVIDFDMVLLAAEINENIKQFQLLVQEVKQLPIHENFILNDIVKVSKGINFNIFISQSFIQAGAIIITMQQFVFNQQQNLSLMNYKLSLEELVIKFNHMNIMRITKNTHYNDFSIWPEYESHGELIFIEMHTTQNTRIKIIEKKIIINLEHIHIDLNYNILLSNLQIIQQQINDHINLFKITQQQSQSIQTINKQNQTKISLKIGLFKNTLQINFSDIYYQIQFQSYTHIQFYKKGIKIKTLEIKHNQLQFQIVDQQQHIMFTIIGFNFIFDYYKQISILFDIQLIQIRIHSKGLTQLYTVIQCINQQQQKSNVIQDQQNNNQNKIFEIKLNLNLQMLQLDFGQLIKPINFISLFTFIQKQTHCQISIQDNKLQGIIVNTNVTLWTTHPLQNQSIKITNTIQFRIIWNKNQIENQNMLQALNSINIKLSQITISNILNILYLLNHLEIIPIIKNKTKQKLLIEIYSVTNQYKFILNPDDIVPIPTLYNNIINPIDYPIYQIRLGLDVNETLQFWSNPTPFYLSKQYFCKFVILDVIDQQEHDIFLKALGNEYTLSQIDKNAQDLQNIAEPLIDNQSEYIFLFKSGNIEQIQVQPNCQQIFHTKLTEHNILQFNLVTENTQEIKFTLTQSLKTVLSFNFVKIDNNFYNVLLSLEFIKDPKGQYIQRITIKPFLRVINLLPWAFKIGSTQTLNLPISVDTTMNNSAIHNFQLDQFYTNLLEKRKHVYNPSQQIQINNQQTNLYYMTFLKEGKYAIEINQRHHMIMIFRNNTLINNQLCFVICRNIYQSQIKYLLFRNQTQYNFILMKNKSRIHISPNSDNCLEYNIQKGDKYRIFVTNYNYEQLWLLDTETLTKYNLKVTKTQISNIHIVQISINSEKMVGQEFGISLPQIKIIIQISDKQELQLSLDLNLRYFKQNQIDILIQQLLLQQENQTIFKMIDCFSILEASNSQDLNISLINNFFLKIKEINIHINQIFLNSIKLLIGYIHLDPIFKEQQLNISNPWDSLVQITILILNMIIDPIQLDIQIETNLITLNNSLQLPQLQLKTSKFKPTQLKSEIISFYLAFLLTKIPSIQLLIQNIPNPFALLKKIEVESIKLPYFFLSYPIKTKHFIQDYTILSKRCKIKQLESQLQNNTLHILRDKIIIITNENQIEIQLSQIQEINRNENSIIIKFEVSKQLIIETKNSNLILMIIKQLVY